MTDLTRLTGLRVAITGGARGIGAATARAFAEHGASVAIGDLDADLALRTAKEIAGSTGSTLTGSTLTGMPLDVTDPLSFDAFVTAAADELGGLDVVVNNAGIMPTGYFLDEPDEVTARQLEINLRGVITGCKIAGRRFRAEGRGQLVNIASIAGVAAFPGAAVYCAGKHAVVGLSTALQQELAPFGVTVTAIAPGFVNTELIAGLAPSRLVRAFGLVEPADVAKAVVTAVARGRGGTVFVPRFGGSLTRALSAGPQRLRNGMARLMGLDTVLLRPDPVQRADYRERIGDSTPLA